MLFNSIDFAIFLPLVFLLYWLVFHRTTKMQNYFLVVVSYLFYGWWDYRFLALIVFSSLLDYLVGIKIEKTHQSHGRKVWLAMSLIVNFGLLGLFKYYNFFADSFVEVFNAFGHTFQTDRLNIILPVGISFYTFQTVSYSIDVYRNKIPANRDFIAFLAYVSFFPQLVAGPIERANNLLPQFQRERTFQYNSGMLGITQIVWGLFKKMVIADNCAVIVNQIFADQTSYTGSTLLLGAILFAFQIYGDFSGYSDIAIGSAKLLGFDLMRNFAYPFFSRDIAEFWRRWHISLSSWFRDYLYIPLGGSRKNKATTIRNIFIIFIVSGFWHGANWTFVAWGFLHALFFLPLYIGKRNRNNIDIIAKDRLLPTVRESIQMLFTFGLTTIAWVFFRSDNIGMACGYIQEMCSASLFTMPYVFGIGKFQVIITFASVIIMLIIEWFGRKKEVPIYMETRATWKQWIIIYIISMLIFLLFEKQQEFIYFQF